ncbi:MAG TPA: response regulator [Thermoanaerobaculia bacterium]|jgi:CheY-like chemotaxis protein|nr:response regulator [Thermoanaerobaculia bacterium]HQP88429.1 response regulator [Thermoanaerobaculia bacterium]
MALIASYEDDPGMAEVLEHYIREAGWDWRLVPDTDRALEFLQGLRPDLVTTGNRQCSMSGPAFAAALKADPALREVPVVFVTAFSAQDELWEQLRALGLDPDRQIAGYVAKPFAREELVAAIRHALPDAGVKQELSLDDVIANLLSNGPPISGPEPLGRPGLPDLLLGRRFFSSSIWDVGFRALGPAARTERIARLFETDPEVARWFRSQVARNGTSTLLVLAAVLGTRAGETTGPG